MSSSNVGITSLGISFPPFYMHLSELARLRGVDSEKYTKGLGLNEMALCGNQCTVIDLAIQAAQDAISSWGGNVEDIAMIAVGTETPVDYSRPLSAWVASELKIQGYVRSYEVKHACYGGTLALLQAAEWYQSNPDKQKVALVIAVDEALYAQNDPGEPTQGAGAVAFIVGPDRLATINAGQTIAYSEPVFDFWKPLDKHYPEVNGQYSLECYKQAAVSCYKKLVQDRDPLEVLNQYSALCFHVPFPKMVFKAFYAVGESLGLNTDQINNLYETRVNPFMVWNQRCGNAYTASLWIMFAHALAHTDKQSKSLLFSYGSGMGSELIQSVNNSEEANRDWIQKVDQQLSQRQAMFAKDYLAIRESKPAE
ncbi:Polyketide biosynthesis 3-hydroxy-3-methylglutaryl-ACP synthase PksG [Legionella birminghamensis]|uniref:Polyketide biosynthesis 3-hydroxy-3 -methylglutaryl-ACP synthase pksG n=1 Tax=Legionella birminghamensis TaxID=28083 RepID=A0A378IAQ6_9GAMM|nr:hydroxymethylglutaryl-CoA synthase [Legionella birminghamensis]KTC75204.1 Polyketide biosynthesis 3-hydroxy-3-methylglutaryl-ACP synthase PksG [Legionella birminghamensis]STX31845.1 Polyketide biosynthesis 3-hydroxy-3 -methylglutaryl-ACP synthase pksG [Legionella birminghamensis]